MPELPPAISAFLAHNHCSWTDASICVSACVRTERGKPLFIMIANHDNTCALICLERPSYMQCRK